MLTHTLVAWISLTNVGSSWIWTFCQWQRSLQHKANQKEIDRRTIRERHTQRTPTHRKTMERNLLSLSSSSVLVVRIATKVSLTELDRESKAGRGRVERSLSRLLRPSGPGPGPTLSTCRWEISFDLRFWSFSNVYNTKHTKMPLWRWCNKRTSSLQ